MARTPPDIFSAIRKRHAHWARLHTADGEYKDFTKFDYSAAEKGGLGQSELVLPKSMMPGGITLSSLATLPPSSIPAAKKHLFCSSIDSSSDKPLSWHGAHVQDGAFLHVPSGQTAPPLTIQTRASGHSALHHLLILENGASADVIIHANGSDAISSPSLHTDLSEAVLGEGARLTLTTIQDYSTRDWAFSHHFHHLGKFACLTHTVLATGAAMSRTRAINHLDGPRSRAESYQLFAGGGGQFMDLASRSLHHAPDTQGVMTCRGVMDGPSTGVYMGAIVIDPPASNTLSHQSGSALLLSSDSKANIIPSLTVKNDQVEAGHGATIGSPDLREMFYLRSRGLDEPQARRLILSGFFSELIGKIQSAPAQSHLSKLVDRYLSSRPSGPAQRPPPVVQKVLVPGNEARPSAQLRQMPGNEARPSAQLRQMPGNEARPSAQLRQMPGNEARPSARQP